MTIWTITAHDPSYAEASVLVIGTFTSQEPADRVTTAFKEEFPSLDIQLHETTVQEEEVYLSLLEHYKEVFKPVSTGV